MYQEATLPPPPVDSPPRPPSPPRADPEINEQHGDSDSSTPEDSQQGSLPESEGGEEVPGQLRSLQVLDGHIPLGSVVWRGGGARATRGVALAAGVKVQSTEVLTANGVQLACATEWQCCQIVLDWVGNLVQSGNTAVWTFITEV